MSDRPHTDLPLAEIVGWTNDGPDGYGSTWWISPDGDRVRLDDPPQPTVDDLLDWLVDQGWTWAASKWQNQVTVRVIYIETGVCAVHDLYGPTLAVALHQAVRLVHDLAAGG